MNVSSAEFQNKPDHKANVHTLTFEYAVARAQCDRMGSKAARTGEQTAAQQVALDRLGEVEKALWEASADALIAAATVYDLMAASK